MVRLKFEREKETRRTVRYLAVDELAGVPMVYVDKRLVAQLGNPQSIALTVEAVGDELAVAA
jgi:hypothetical protein